MNKSKIINFVDQAVKQKSIVPGVGIYNPEKSLDRISKGVTARKR